MRYKETLAANRIVDELVGDIDESEIMQVVPQELVMIAGCVVESRPFSTHLQQSMEDPVVDCRPAPLAL